MKNQKNFSIFFFGSSDFSLYALKSFLENLGNKDLKITIVTLPPQKAGRGLKESEPKIKKFAEKLKLNVLQPESLDKKFGQLIKKNADIILVASYGKILPDYIYNGPKFGSLNIHPSLLPKYRGPSPIQYTILAGEKKTGVTIAKITEKIDAGDILVQEKVNIEPNDNFKTLEEKLAQVGGKLAANIIPLFIENKISPLPQNELKATYTYKIKKEDGFLDFKKPALYLERMIRAFYPWPGCFTYFENKILKIIEAQIFDINSGEKPGKLFIFQNKPAFQTTAGILVCNKLQIEGKKIISGEDFVRGYLKKKINQ